MSEFLCAKLDFKCWNLLENILPFLEAWNCKFFCERDHFLMSIFIQHGMRPSVRYLMIFWKHKIPKLSSVAASFLVVSFSRKVRSATFKKGQKSETGIAEAEETEVLLQSEHSQSRPLLKVFWSMFGTYFLLSTVCLVICDVFLFSIPKLLRYVHIYNVFLSITCTRLLCAWAHREMCMSWQHPQRWTHKHLSFEISYCWWKEMDYHLC